MAQWQIAMVSDDTVNVPDTYSLHFPTTQLIAKWHAAMVSDEQATHECFWYMPQSFKMTQLTFLIHAAMVKDAGTCSNGFQMTVNCPVICSNCLRC